MPTHRLLAPRVWLAVIALYGAVDAWGSRYNLNPDGISYLEMARHALAGAPDGFTNGYWSPGYPALISPLLALTGHHWVTTIPALHMINFLLYLVSASLCISLFRMTSGEQLSRYAFVFGGTAFVLIAIKCIGLGLLTPDMAVMFAVLGTAGCCLQLERSNGSLRWTALLGVVLGLGYWMKGILLPLNVLLLAGLFIVPPRIAGARARVALAALVFLLVCLPQLIMVSLKVGKPSIGEVGRLNYAWEVNGVTPFAGWLGDTVAEHGSPLHPPRLVRKSPETLEFSTPISATYPLWFDPSYWYAGVEAHFDPRGQWRVLQQGLADVWLVVLQLLVLIGGVIGIWLTSRSRRLPEPPTGSRVGLVLGAWSLAAIAVYALVHVEPRYLGGFIAVVLLSAWQAVGRRRFRPAIKWVVPIVVVVMLVSAGQHIKETTGGYRAGYLPDYILEAERLRASGVTEGDRLAMVGDAFEAYAAFAADAPIGAQVTDSAAYWELPSEGRDSLNSQLAAVGIKALLANNVAAGFAAEGWRIFPRPDSSNLGILMLFSR